jgi:hypothetical protein
LQEAACLGVSTSIDITNEETVRYKVVSPASSRLGPSLLTNKGEEKCHNNNRSD